MTETRAHAEASAFAYEQIHIARVGLIVPTAVLLCVAALIFVFVVSPADDACSRHQALRADMRASARSFCVKGAGAGGYDAQRCGDRDFLIGWLEQNQSVRVQAFLINEYDCETFDFGRLALAGYCATALAGLAMAVPAWLWYVLGTAARALERARDGDAGAL